MTRTRTYARYTNEDRIKNLKKLYVYLLKYDFHVERVNRLGDNDYEICISRERKAAPNDTEWVDEVILLSPESD